MPKNKFNGFYYGIGMKLDEASVDKAGQQLEGRLNQVVDNITQKVGNISEAIAKGVKDVDTKELIKGLADAQKELSQFQNFDPGKLQKQIDSLNTTVASLGDSLGAVSVQLKSFTDDVTSRLSNIEIKTSKQGKDALKADLKGIIELARGYRDVISKGVEVDTSALDKYFIKIKQGFKSIENSGNAMELFTDKELAQYFVSFTNILRQMGEPVEKLRGELFSLSSTFKTAFEKSNATGAQSIFKNIGYQIEAVNVKLRKSQEDLARYEASIAKAQSRIKSTGFDITVDGDKNLNFDAKIARIQEYGAIIAELDYGEEWATATKNQIALIQAAEKELQAILKTSDGQVALDKWKRVFGFDLTDKFSTDALSEYIEVAKKSLVDLKTLHEKTKREMDEYQSDLGRLMAKEAATSVQKVKKTTTSAQKQQTSNISANVKAHITINEKQWANSINSALKNIAKSEAVKPFKIKVEATSGNILKEVKKIKDAALVDGRKNGDSDVKAFNTRFDKFKTNLETRRKELAEYLKTEWHPALKDAFSFKMEILGVDNKSLTKNINEHLLSTVDAINIALEEKPIVFHSNIDTLINEIESKIQDLKIEGNVNLGAGNISVNPQSIGNIGVILGGIAQSSNAGVAQPAPVNVQPTITTTPSPKKQKSSKSNKKPDTTAEDMYEHFLEEGKRVLKYYIEMAELGRKLNSIREIADKRITADMFDDGEITKWIRGKSYTKDDIGSYAPGKKITPEAVDKFLATMGITEADLAEANTKEESEFLAPLKKYVYGFMQNREQLNELLSELMNNQTGKSIVEGYNASDIDKTQYLTSEITNILSKAARVKKSDKQLPGVPTIYEFASTPTTKGEQAIQEVLRESTSLLGELQNSSKTNEQWVILQKIIPQLLNGLKKREAEVGRPTGKTYTQLEQLLQLSKAYSSTSESLRIVGTEANDLISGVRADVDREIKEFNPETGMWEKTGNWDTVSKVVKQGVRGILKQLKVVIEDAAGNAVLGYNLGKGYISDDVYLGANESFSKIIKSLTNGSKNASRIRFDSKMFNGSKDFDIWEPPSSIVKPDTSDYKFTTVSTEKSQIEKYINGINTLINGYQSKLKQINEQFNSIVSEKDRKVVQDKLLQADNKENSLKQAREQISQVQIKIQALQNSLVNPAPLYEDVLKSLLDEESKLAKLEAEIKQKSADKSNYNDELELDKLVEEKKRIKNRIANLKTSAKVASLGTSDDKINAEINKETTEIARLETELKNQQGVEQAQTEKEIERKKKYINNLQTALKSRERAKTTEAIESELSSRQSELVNLQNEETKIKNELNTLNNELSKFGDSDVIKQIALLIKEQKEYLAEIQRQRGLLAEQQEKLKSADDKNVSYSKTYDQAEASLPHVQEEKKYNKLVQQLLSKNYQVDQISMMVTLDTKVKQGEISQSDKNQILGNIPDIQELNKQLSSGVLIRDEYIKKVTDAYILMRNAATEEAKATAKADAEKLANAALLVKKYQDEEKILKRIIQTQKPKVTQPKTTEPTGGSSNIAPIGTSGDTNINNPNTVAIPGGNIVLSGITGAGGIATEDTLSKIYALLSTKRGGANTQYDSRIEALKKAIAAKEAEERASLEATRKKTSEEKKGTEEVKKKNIEEKKGTTEVKKKTVEEKKGTSEVKKKTSEEKKGVEEVKKKNVEEKEKPVAENKKPTTSPKQTEQGFLAATRKTYKEIASGNKIMREKSFYLAKNTITQTVEGLMASVLAKAPDNYDTHGHLHPRNSMYSSSDITAINTLRKYNKSYNSDLLVTPDYVYKLGSIAKVSNAEFDNLYDTFKKFEASKMNDSLLNKAKESLLYYFAKDNGLSYSKNTYDDMGNLTDITGQDTLISREALNTLKEFVNVIRQNKHNSAEEYKAWQDKKNSLMNALKKDSTVSSLMLNSDQDKQNERKWRDAYYHKVRSGTLIQEAVDYDFDLSLFITQFQDFFSAIDKLGEKIQRNSPLAKIKQYVQDLSLAPRGSAKHTNIIKQIETLSRDVFGGTPDRHIDSRFVGQLEAIGLRDKSGKIAKTIATERSGGRILDVTNEDFIKNILAKNQASSDDIAKSLHKNVNDFWNAVRDYNEDVQGFNRIFREHSFAFENGVVKKVGIGSFHRAKSFYGANADTYGHMHPRNSMYSSSDIDSIKNIRARNSTYNTDMLITPDYVYKFDGIANLTVESLEELKNKFNLLEHSFSDIYGNTISLSNEVKTRAKESIMHQFSENFSKNVLLSDNTLKDITGSVKFLGNDAVDALLNYISGSISKTLKPYEEAHYSKILKNDAGYMDALYKSNPESGAIHSAYRVSASILQGAVDNNYDLKLFYQNLIDLLNLIDSSGQTIPNDSVLGRIKKAVALARQSFSDPNEQAKVMDNIKPDLIKLLGYNKNFAIEDKYLGAFRDDIAEDVNNDTFKEILNQTLEEMRAELAGLEKARDEGQVDPRFATAEKQDVIIELLRNGVKIAGKGTNAGDSSSESSTKKKEPERASADKTIDVARKEVDSAKNAASSTVKDTGEIITKTAQKCGAEVLNITKTVKNGVESTTVSINNDYETAMKKTHEQISAKEGRGLFGMPYDANINVETTEAQAALNKYVETYNKLEELITKFKSLDLSTKSGKTEASKLQLEIDAAQKDLDFFEDKLINIAINTERFLGGKEAFTIMDTGALDQTGISLKLLAQQTEGAMVAFNGLYNDGTKLIYDVFDPATSSFKRYSLEVDKATGYVRKMETAQTGLVNAFQNVNKVRRQSADIEGISDVNTDSSLVKKYAEARQQLDKAVNDAWTRARNENRLISLDEQKDIYAMSNEVLRLGKRILSTANSFKNFKDQGGQAFEVVRDNAESLESAMRKIATEQALDDKMSIGNISYNDATKKMSYELTDLDGNVRKVTMAYVEMFNQVKITSDNSVAAMDKVSAAIREDIIAIDNAVDAGLIDTRTDTYLEYEKELRDMLAYKEQLDATDDRITQNEIDNLNMRKAAVKALGEELVAMAKKNAVSMGQGSKDVQNEVNQKNTIDVGVNNALLNTVQYQSYLSAYQAMIDKQEEFRRNGVLAGQSEQDQLSRLAKTTRIARGEFEQLAKASANFDSKIKNPNTDSMVLPTNFDYDKLEQEMKSFVLSQDGLTQSQKKMIEKTWSFKNAQDGATYSVRQGKDQVASMSVIFDEGTRRIGQYTVETNKYRTGMEKFMDSLKGKYLELTRYLATFGSFYRIVYVLRQGITYVREIDSALTELKKVTDETEESYDRFLDTAAKTADKVGSTIKEVVSSTADWARLGYSIEEAAHLAESTSVLLNVSEFDSIDSATSALISTMQAFGYAANDSMHVIDVMNIIGNNFAVSTDGLATALQDSASALMTANNSYEQAAAMVAAANKVVQNPSEVGSALRTISLRLRGTKVSELEEMGEDTTGAVETQSKLRSKLKGLTGIDILTDSGAYKSTYEILLEISKVWDKLTDENRAGALELIAGKNRANVASALLSNTKDLEEAYMKALEAEGSALRENEKYLDSIQGKIDQFNNAVQTMWSNALDDSVIKGFVEFGTILVKIIDQIGLIPSLLSAVGITKILPSILTAVTPGANNFGEVLKTLAFGAQYAGSSIGEIIVSTTKASATAAKNIPTWVSLGHTLGGVKGAALGLTDGLSKLWATIPMAGKIMLIVAAVSAVIAVVDGLTTSTKELREITEEAITEYENATNTLKDHHNTIKEIKDDYKRLSNGVDDFGNNISLSTSEYERYNEIVNQIADMFPEMVSGYTEEGNAIIALKGNVEALTEAYEKEAQAARDAILIKSNDIFENFKNNTTDSGSVWTGKYNKVDDLKYIEDLLDGELDNFEATDFGGTSGLSRWFKEAGIEGPSVWDMILGNADFDDYMEILRDNLPQIQAYYRILKSEIEAEATSVKTVLNAYLEQDFDYLKLSDDAKNIVHSIVNQFDSEFYSQFESASQMEAWVTTNLIQPLQDANKVSEFKLAFDLQTKFNNGDVPADEYQKNIQEFLDILKALGFSEDIIKSVTLMFDIEDVSTKVNHVKELLVDSDDKKAESLSKEDLDIIDEWEIDDDALLTWDQLIKKLEEAKKTTEETSITDSISKISQLEDAYNSLGDAIQEFKEDGTASAKTLESLQETFGETDGFEELYKVLATGEGNVEEAITNVANAYITRQGILSDLTDDEIQIMSARLQALGVINAQEVLQQRQVAQQTLNDRLDGYDIDLSAYATAEEAKIAIALMAGLDLDAITDDNFEYLLNKYSDEVDAFADKEKQKVQIAQAAAREQATASKETALSNLDVKSEDYNSQKQAIEKQYNNSINNINSMGTALSNIDSILNNYYSKSFKFNFSGNKIGIGRDYKDDITDKTKSDADKADQEARDKLDEVKKEYENKISLLESEQTYLENEIARAEAEDEQVGKAVYERQIDLEKEKIDLLKQERNAILAEMANVAKGSDAWYEYANAVWEVEHSIQDSTLAIIEFQDKIAQLYVDAFTKVEEAYGHLENLRKYQQDYINNDLEYAELIDKPISADYYKSLMDIQKKAYSEALAEAADLQHVLDLGLADGSIEVGSEEYIDLKERIWESTLAVQENRNEIEKTNEELKQLYVTAYDKVREAYSVIDSLNNDRRSYVEGHIELEQSRGESVSTDAYYYLISNTTDSISRKIQEIADLEEKLNNAEVNGIKEGSEDWIKLQEEMRAAEKELQDNYILLEQYNEELKQLYYTAFEKVATSFSDVTDVYEDQQAFVESYVDYLETLGIDVPAEMYEELGTIEEQKQQANIRRLAELEESLAKMEAEGFTPEDEEWVKAQAEIRATEKAIWDSEVAMAEFNKRVRDLEIEKFEEFIKRIEDVVTELDNVYDLLSKEDVATEDGAWTEEGVASLGLMYQKMEIAKKQMQEYQEEIDKLTASYRAGEISEQEYNDRLVELKNSQWDAIDSYESAKDAIIDINEARVDMIEEGIQKEIDAYQELIDLKKKELDAERDLYEFRKDIQNQTKDIATLERKIAAMSGSTDAATIAERTKLEAQLREAREGLDDTYYSHAMDSQSSALDDESESYVTSKEDYIEMLRESLENTKQIVAETMAQVLINADTVLGELNNVSGEYGITLSESLTSPWISAATQAEAFKNSALAQEYEFAIQNDIFTGTITQQLSAMFGAGSQMANMFQIGVQGNIDAIKIHVNTSTSELISSLQIPYETARGYVQNTFSPEVMAALQGVADKAQELVVTETKDLTDPWNDGTEAANTFGEKAEEVLKRVKEKAVEYNPTDKLKTPPTEAGEAYGLFETTVETVFTNLVTDASDAATKIGTSMTDVIEKARLAAAEIAKVGGSNSGGTNIKGTLSSGNSTQYKQLTPANDQYSALKKTGTLGQQLIVGDESYFKNKLVKIDGVEYYQRFVTDRNGTTTTYYYKASESKKTKYDGGRSTGIMFPVGTSVYKFAKGTLGTKKDNLAITDELGDELVLIPGKDGNLQYMRKGTAVIPAEISANLMEWGKLNPNMDGVSSAIQGVNLITNVVNKPELNLAFENLLHIDNCTNEVIPEVKKIITEQLENFTKKLNYNLKRIGSTT